MSTTWTPLPAMPTPRRSCAMAAVGQGARARIYVVGGYQRSSRRVLDAVEAFNLQTGAWEPRRPMPTPRCGHAAVVFGTLLYVIGGYNHSHGFLSTVDVYDPEADCWNPGSPCWQLPDVAPVLPLNAARAGHAAVSIDGGVLVVGGFNDESGYLATTEAFLAGEPGTPWPWVTRPEKMATPRAGLAAVRHADGKVYAVGGANAAGALGAVEAYDGSAWAPVPSLATPRARPAAATLAGVIYVFGGFDTGGGGTFVGTTEAFVGGAWKADVPPTGGRYGLAGGAAYRRIYAFGGYDGSSDLGMAEALSPGAVITGIAPTSGRVGQLLPSVVVTGQHLGAVTTADFGANVAASVVSASATRVVLRLTIARAALGQRPFLLGTPTETIPSDGLTFAVGAGPDAIDLFPEDSTPSPFPEGQAYPITATARVSSDGVVVPNVCLRFQLNQNRLGGCTESDANGVGNLVLLRPGQGSDGDVWTVLASVDIDRNGTIDATDPRSTTTVTWQAVLP